MNACNLYKTVTPPLKVASLNVFRSDGDSHLYSVLAKTGNAYDKNITVLILY